MLLVVDVGNTQTHFGTFRGEQLLEHWRFATVRQSTADQLGAALRNLLELRGHGFGDLDASIVSSTVPQLEPEWTAMADRYLGHEMLVVGPGIKTGMAIGYAGAIDAILRRLFAELGERASVIATGGLSSLVVAYCEEIEEVDDLLTLTGLRLLHELNSN